MLKALLIGIISGFLATKIMNKNGNSIIVNCLVGVMGSFIGGILFRLAGISSINIVGEILASCVGSCVFIFLLDRFLK